MHTPSVKGLVRFYTWGLPSEAAQSLCRSVYSGCLSPLSSVELYGVNLRHFFPPTSASRWTVSGFLLLTCCPPGMALSTTSGRVGLGLTPLPGDRIWGSPQLA